MKNIILKNKPGQKTYAIILDAFNKYQPLQTFGKRAQYLV